MVSRMYPPPVSPRSGTKPEAEANTSPAQAAAAALAAAAAKNQAPESTPRDGGRPAMDWPEIASAPTKDGATRLGTETNSIDPLDAATAWPTPETRAPRVTPPVSVSTAPPVRAERTPAPSGSVATLEAPAAPDTTGPVMVDDLGLDTSRSRLSPRFEFAPVAERTDRRTSKVGRVAQGVMLLGLIAAVGAFIVMLPDAESSIESAQPTDRVEAVDRPAATAEILSDENAEIEGSLGDTGGFGNLTAFAAPTPGTPADGGDGFKTAVAEVVEDAPADATTTTTAWVEPALPPESEWVDSGNGVMVPDLLLRIRFCESTNNYLAASNSSTARGAYQFLIGSWDWYGHAARTGVTEAHLATPAQQDQSALLTLQSEGTSPWHPSRKCWADPDIDPRYATATPPQQTTTTTVAEEDPSTTVADEDTTTTTEEDSTPETTVPEESTTTTEDTMADSETTTTTPVEEESTTTTVDDSGTTTTAAN